MSKNKIIYWSNNTQDFNIEPDSLLIDISKSQNSTTGRNYLSCPSIRDKHKNTFIERMPYDLDVDYTQGFKATSGVPISNKFGLYENSHMFALNLSKVFFAPEPQI